MRNTEVAVFLLRAVTGFVVIPFGFFAALAGIASWQGVTTGFCLLWVLPFLILWVLCPLMHKIGLDWVWLFYLPILFPWMALVYFYYSVPGTVTP